MHKPTPPIKPILEITTLAYPNNIPTTFDIPMKEDKDDNLFIISGYNYVFMLHSKCKRLLC